MKCRILYAAGHEFSFENDVAMPSMKSDWWKSGLLEFLSVASSASAQQVSA
jgi:hypothetical protein